MGGAGYGRDYPQDWGCSMILFDQWLDAKEAERAAVERRRQIEDGLIAALSITESEGSTTIKTDGYKVKVTQRFKRNINADIQEVMTAAHSITQPLSEQCT